MLSPSTRGRKYDLSGVRDSHDDISFNVTAAAAGSGLVLHYRPVRRFFFGQAQRFFVAVGILIIHWVWFDLGQKIAEERVRGRMVGPVVVFLVTVIGLCCRACEVLMRQFSPYVSIFGLVFSYWLTKFSGSKVPHGGSAHDRDLEMQINDCSS